MSHPSSSASKTADIVGDGAYSVVECGEATTELSGTEIPVCSHARHPSFLSF